MLQIDKMVLRVAKKDILGTLFISFGVLAGLLLLKQSQDFREKAQTTYDGLYTICHKTGDSDNPWEEIEVGENEIYFHLSHGDRVGECRFIPTPIPTPTFYYPIPTATTTVTVTPTVSLSPSLSPIPTATPTTKPTFTPTPLPEITEPVIEELPTEPVEVVVVSSSVTFSIKFQSVQTKRPDQVVRVEMHPEAGHDLVFDEVQVEANSDGVYLGTITGVKPGVYDVYIKGVSHLRRKVSGVEVGVGDNKYDWMDVELLAGDFDGNNLINLYDVALLIRHIKKESNLITGESLNYDVNFDGIIDLLDIDEVLNNYSDLEVKGE